MTDKMIPAGAWIRNAIHTTIKKVMIRTNCDWETARSNMQMYMDVDTAVKHIQMDRKIEKNRKRRIK